MPFPLPALRNIIAQSDFKGAHKWTLSGWRISSLGGAEKLHAGGGIPQCVSGGVQRRIQSLEHWLGTALIVKGAVPVRLTEAGEQFVESAAASISKLLEARSSIRGNQFEVMSQVRIAMPNVLARSEFRRVLGVLEGQVRSSFSVTVGTTNDVIARYLAGDADILFAHDSLALPMNVSLAEHDRLVLRRDRFMPYATRDPAKRRLSASPRLAARALPPPPSPIRTAPISAGCSSMSWSAPIPARATR